VTAAPAIRRAVFTVTNPTAEPTDEWVRAVARLLLAAADRQLAEREQAARADECHKEQPEE